MMLKQAENQVNVRKYANHHLCDTSASRYVTIDDLSMMVKDNIYFSVVDAENGLDITGLPWFRLLRKLSRQARNCRPLGFQCD